MEKARVYELAKDLNTSSKRLIEKLAEINIVVKNHMSLLEPNELEALYKHIGVVRHSGDKPNIDERKPAAETVHRAEPKKEVKKDAKSAPRIIRKTEIIIDTKEENKEAEKHESLRNEPKGDVRGDVRGNNKYDVVRQSNSSSGLRPGFIRDTGVDYKKEARPAMKSHEPVKKESKNEQLENEQPKTGVKPEPKVETGVDTVKESMKAQKHDVPAEAKGENKIQIQEDIKSVEKVIQPARQEDEKNKIEQKARVNDVMKGESANINTSINEQVNTGEVASKVSEGEANNIKRDRQQGDEFRGSNDRPQDGNFRGPNDRPQDGNFRGPNDRPQDGNFRGPNDRPQDGNFRGPNDRPQDGNFRGPNDRPQDGNFRGPNDRPQGGNFRGPNDRPQGGNFRGPNDRPQGGNFRGPNDRPQGGNFRGPGDRPQGGNFRGPGDRPQGGNFRGPGDRPQGGNYGNRPGGDRPHGSFRSGPKPLEIPKVELTAAQKEEMNSQRSEVRREFQNKDFDKDVKREQKKEVPKGQPGERNKRFKPQKVMLGEKKGVDEVLSEDYILEEFYGDDGVKRTKKTPKARKGDNRYGMGENRHIPHKAVLTNITIGETITVKELAESLKKTATEIIKKLMGLGIMATLNQELDFDTATLIADEFSVATEKAVVVSEEDILFDEKEEEDDEFLESRPPVVVVMGHVDHGKTSLLDAIREANVIDSEAGGITQHIGAYMVKINNRNITFLDTPGHEAFTAMRARGAQVTDIAILVVAADDGVMPQTIEAINHAKAANVSIIVAINKIDKPGANPDRVKQELTEYGIVAEEWGGDAIMVPVSAKKRENIDHLLEMVLLASDMLELKANPKRQAKGTVIEAKLDKGRGPVATVLVQRGTLLIGDSIVTGTTVGRIRAMTDDKGHQLKKAGPSTPVEILGLPEVPEAGEIFYAITDEKVAKQLAEKRKQKLREQQLKASAKVSLDDLFNQIKEGKVKDLNIIVKADVQGSVEAVKQSLEKLTNEEVRVKIIHGGVGAITESDVSLAQVSNAIIIGFNVRPGTNVTEAAENAGVDLRLYRVIYNAIEDVQAAMKGMLEPTFKEVIQGHAEIRQIFKVSGIGTIGGSYVTDGKVTRNSEIRVIRDGIVVHEGKLASLKRFKDDAKEVAHGYECGISVEKFNDIKEGDIVESFIMEEVAR
ncbi:MAG: translation initiation factor IF-2 [Clostridia bacterium]|nr:translation initiation factor IF-2 [Clostridia bacterium]